MSDGNDEVHTVLDPRAARAASSSRPRAAGPVLPQALRHVPLRLRVRTSIPPSRPSRPSRPLAEVVAERGSAWDVDVQRETRCAPTSTPTPSPTWCCALRRSTIATGVTRNSPPTPLEVRPAAPHRVRTRLGAARLARLAPGGTAALLLPPTVASRRAGRRIRAALLRPGVLRALVALPPGAHRRTASRCTCGCCGRPTEVGRIRIWKCSW